ncbi:two-component sensor histidine kinase [Prauserella muralis]|uniref:histidine kinase n=1 Tax=Prauserella muralis TaxID=588067 RepID=A0A2V4B3A7_9PSEU|nr:two-component sensor histidine kinase [Prauserella muralis]
MSVLSTYRALPGFAQDLLVAVAFVAGGSALYAADMHAFAGHDPVPGWGRHTLLVAVAAPLLLRRRAPATGLCLAAVPLAADIALGPTVPVLLAFTDHLYAVTLYGSRRANRVLVTVAAAGSLAVTVGALVLTADWRTAVLVVVVYVPFVAVPVWWATNIRQHRELAETEREAAARLARIAELDRDAAVAAERARMARDLHDVIAGHLSAIALQSEAALSTPDPTAAGTVLRSVRENSVSALEEMRAMIGLLRTGESAETTAPARLSALSKLVESARASGMRVEVHSELGGEPGLPAAVDLAAYRIAQEALTNAVRHAPGSSATVTVRRADDELTVEVVNELTGTQDGKGQGTGLLSMRERAQAVGGSLSAGPAGHGWRVRAVLPVGRVRS